MARINFCEADNLLPDNNITLLWVGAIIEPKIHSFKYFMKADRSNSGKCDAQHEAH